MLWCVQLKSVLIDSFFRNILRMNALINNHACTNIKLYKPFPKRQYHKSNMNSEDHYIDGNAYRYAKEKGEIKWNRGFKWSKIVGDSALLHKCPQDCEQNSTY